MKKRKTDKEVRAGQEACDNLVITYGQTDLLRVSNPKNNKQSNINNF